MVTRRCSVKKVLLKVSQNSQENICTRVSFLIKLQASLSYRNQSANQWSGFNIIERPATLSKRDSGTGVFLLVFAKFLTTSFFKERLHCLLLKSISMRKIGKSMDDVQKWSQNILLNLYTLILFQILQLLRLITSVIKLR